MLLFLFLCFFCVAHGQHNLQDKSGKILLKASADGSYQVLIGGAVWFTSGPTMFQGKGKTDTSEDGTLALVQNRIFNGSDALGSYSAISYDWKGSQSGYSFTTTFRMYVDTPAVVFRASFANNVTGTDNGDYNELASSFPTIKLDGPQGSRGYVTWAGNMCWQNQHVGNWNNQSSVPGGAYGGVPIVVFDQAYQNAAVLSPFSNFMSVNQATWTTKSSGKVIGFGVVGSVLSIPEDYSYETIIYAGNRISDSVLGWGAQLRKFYGKGLDELQNDYSINYLGYYTDAGACYWYNQGDVSYQETLEEVFTQADAAKIPLRYLQLDSWWYYKGLANGVKNWTLMNGTEYFPDGGLTKFQQTIKRPIVAHNRYWSANTDYATSNGGKYEFILEFTGNGTGYDDYAIPTDVNFWPYLIGEAVESFQLITYEQDWLDTEYDNVQHLRQDTSLGRTWLLEMNNGAETHGVTIQFCMSYPRHVLQSVEMPAVTQSRASNDYYPNNDQWQLGETSLFFHALGLAPFKDTFRSDSSDQGCSTAHGDTPEQTPVLEAIVSALSTGPVGPGDKVGKLNRTLIMQTCMDDGRLLKASIPAVSIDASYAQKAFGTGGPQGQLWNSYTIVDDYVFFHIFAATMDATYNLYPSNLIRNGTAGAFTYLYFNHFQPSPLMIFDASHPIAVPTNGKDFRFWHIVPAFVNGWAILGELTKFVSVSTPRWNHIDVNDGGISLNLRGAPGETVTITFAQQSGSTYTILPYSCVVPADGEFTLSVPGGKCVDN